MPAEFTVKFCCTTVEVPEKVFTPAMVSSVVKSTKFLVADAVPPLAIGSIPVTPDVNGKPVALVNTTAEGVPKFGVASVGEVARTTFPEPVVGISSITPAPVLTLPNTLFVVLTF